LDHDRKKEIVEKLITKIKKQFNFSSPLPNFCEWVKDANNVSANDAFQLFETLSNKDKGVSLMDNAQFCVLLQLKDEMNEANSSAEIAKTF